MTDLQTDMSPAAVFLISSSHLMDPKLTTSTGLLITLMQFIFVALLAYPSQASVSPPSFLKKTKIPLRVLMTSAVMFYTVNMLNNWAFAFDISVPVHIILRSFGSVTTMAAGWLNGKSYSRLQVLSVTTLTIGVLISAFADAQTKARQGLDEMYYNSLTKSRENH